jgi:hypothetical protein
VKLYSYVVHHDTGHAPNPYFDVCTLCRCKFRTCFGKPRNIVELAQEGDWIVGTGGANTEKSAGNGNLVYAMRVDEKLRRKQYYADHRFAKKKPLATGTHAQRRGDNLPPANDFENHEQFVLISRHFYYFGAKPIRIPNRFTDLEKRGPGFKNNFDSAYIGRFVKWLDGRFRLGKHGQPCQHSPDEPTSSCKSSC